MKNIRFLGTAILMLVVVACGNSDLSRSDVKSLIQSNAEFSEPEKSPGLTPRGRENGELQGFWNNKRQLTSKSKEFFVNLSHYDLEVHEALKREVTAVTGIADAVRGGSNVLKEAQFQWQYKDVEGPARRFIVSGGTGKALMRLYDDGWRVENIDVTEGSEGFTLSANEEAAIALEVKAESDRIRKVVAAERRRAELKKREEVRRRQESKKRKLRIAQSKKITRNIASFTCQGWATFGSKKKVTVTDVGVNYNCGTAMSGRSIWYGNLSNFEKAMCNTRIKYKNRPPQLPCVRITKNTKVLFFDNAERDAFFTKLSMGIKEWRTKYSDLLRANK